MRIIHIIHGKCNPNGPNGISRVVYFLNKFQKQVGHQSEVWAFVDGVKKHETFIRDEHVKVEMFPRLSYFSVNHPMINKFKEEKESIDMVHFHMIWFADKNILSKALVKLELPFVATTHGTYSVPLSYKGKKKIARYILELPFLNRASEIHALTPEEKSGLIKYGVKTQAFAVPNGIDKDQIPDTIADDFFKGNQFEGKIKIGWIGVLRKDKNLNLLVDAISFLPADVQEKIQIIIIGPDYKGTQNELTEQARLKGVENKLHFTGALYNQEKYDALNSLDLYIMPSSSEGVSLAILDAMALSKPCILTRGCNMTYHYNKGFFEMCECIADEISKAIFRMIEKRDNWVEIGESGRKLTDEVFNWENVALRTIENYQRIIENA